MESVTDVAARSRNIGLVEALDRVLDKGVLVDGDIYLSVAGIELVYLKLKLLLASTATVERLSSNNRGNFRRDNDNFGPGPSEETSQKPMHMQLLSVSQNPIQNQGVQNPAIQKKESPHPPGLNARILNDDKLPPILNDPRKVNIDPKKVEQGLAKLVLTLVELLRNLMERQALRRMELGTLTNMEVNSLGEAFMMLDEKMKEIKNVFGLKDSDLNLDLGPLGELI